MRFMTRRHSIKLMAATVASFVLTPPVSTGVF
jgi:hypothetical protein